MNAFQLRALERLQECHRVASEPGLPLPTREQTATLRLLVAKQMFRDDAARHSTDLFARIESDNRPTRN